MYCSLHASWPLHCKTSIGSNISCKGVVQDSLQLLCMLCSTAFSGSISKSMYSSKNSVVSGRKVEGRAQGPLILGKKRRNVRKEKSQQARKSKPGPLLCSRSGSATGSLLVVEAKSFAWSGKTWADNLPCMLEETFSKNGEN